MSKVVLDTETITDIADAIRTKTGTTDGIKPNDMADKIDTIPGLPAKGFIFDDYDSDGYPHTAKFVGEWTEIPQYFFNSSYNGTYYTDVIVSRINGTLVIPNGVTRIFGSAFDGWMWLTGLQLPQSLTQMDGSAFRFLGRRGEGVEELHIPSNCKFQANSQQQFRGGHIRKVYFDGADTMTEFRAFSENSICELYDFSHFTTIPALISVDGIGHAPDCVIKVPQALLNDWQSATNWAALTDVVWEGV